MREKNPPICDYEGSDYQERFWEQGTRIYEDRVEAIALRRLMPEGGQRLLELGAGAGRNTPRYKGFEQIVLLDYARSQLELAHGRLGASQRYLYVAADVYKLPFNEGVFDAATMIRTLHHIAQPGLVLRNVRACMQSGGIFILEYANKQNLKAMARWLLRRQDWNPFDQAAVEFAPLNFNFHPRAIAAWLSQAQFLVERRLTVSHFRLNLLKRLLPLQMLVAMDAWAQWTGDWWQLTPSVFVRALAEGKTSPSMQGSIWCCPSCRSSTLESEERGLRCLGCGRLWELREGIYDFRQPLEERKSFPSA